MPDRARGLDERQDEAANSRRQEDAGTVPLGAPIARGLLQKKISNMGLRSARSGESMT